MDKNKFVLELRQHINEFNAVVAMLREYDRIWTSQDLTNNLQQSDLSGENETIAVAELTAGITSIRALDQLLAGGHATNLDKLIR